MPSGRSKLVAACLAGAVVAAPGYVLGSQPPSVRILSFDSLAAAEMFSGRPALPLGWTELPLADSRVTKYEVARVDGRQAVCAVAHGGASTLLKPVFADIDVYRVLRFHLRVEEVVAGGEAGVRERDDFAARIFVNFIFDEDKEGLFSRIGHSLAERVKGRELPGAALNYVWGNTAPAGTSLPSPYTDKVALVVVDSGTPVQPEWRVFERDLVADFTAAFGDAPPPIHSIGIMSDADNTGATAAACFGEITLHRP